MILREYGITPREENNVYWNVLCQAFDGIQAQPKNKGRVLSVACGNFSEGRVVSEFFETKEIYGIDIGAREIKDARRINPHISESSLKTGNAIDIQRIFRDKFDIIFLRRPHPTEDISMWRKILQSTVESLEKDGLLILTTYSLLELQIMLKMLLFMGIKIPLVTENKHPHELMKMYDAYICVIQKGRVIGDFKKRLDSLIKAKHLPDMTSMDRAMRSLRKNS